MITLLVQGCVLLWSALLAVVLLLALHEQKVGVLLLRRVLALLLLLRWVLLLLLPSWIAV
jgi:hypothetical protein